MFTNRFIFIYSSRHGDHRGCNAFDGCHGAQTIPGKEYGHCEDPGDPMAANIEATAEDAETLFMTSVSLEEMVIDQDGKVTGSYRKESLTRR